MADYNINAVTRRVVFTGSAGLGPYAFTFEVLDQNDLAVYLNTTLLTLTTDYTVTINANGTGSVTLVTGGSVSTAPTADDTIVILGARDIERTTDFVTAGDLLAASLNEQLDSNIIFEQQIDERVDRSIKFPPYDSFTGDNELPAAATRADKILKFDTDGNVAVETASAIVGNAVVGANFINNTFTGNGSTTGFTMTAEPGSKNNAQVYIDGVYQLKSSFSVSSTTLTFTEAPPLNAQIEVIIGNAIDTLDADSGNINYNQGGTGAQTRTVESKLQDVVSVKDFGATGDGVTDDTAAIQAAVDASKTIYFPDGVYLISSSITLTNAGQRLIGNGFQRPNKSEQPRIFTATAITAFDIDTSDIVIEGLAFHGSATTAGYEAIDATGNAGNTDDVDLTVRNCSFFQMNKFISIAGRGLRINNNIFNNCSRAIEISWPSSGTAGSGEQALPYGFRVFEITDNRFHITPDCIYVTGADDDDFRGAVIDGNLADLGERFFFGGLRNSVISNNVIEMSSTTPIQIEDGGDGISITGNIITGDEVTPSYPTFGIYFNASSSTFTNISISNNVIKDIDGNAIMFNCAIEDAAITGNVIENVGIDAATRACVWFNGNATRVTVSANSFDPTVGTAKVVYFNSGTTATHCVVGDNSYPISSYELVSGSATFTDNENIQETFTPIVYGTTSAGSSDEVYAANGQIGQVVRRGNFVFVSGQVHLTSTGSGTPINGSIQIRGLPYTASNTTGLNQIADIAVVDDLTFAAGDKAVYGQIDPNTDYIRLFFTQSGGVSNSVGSADIGNNLRLYFSAEYAIDV